MFDGVIAFMHSLCLDHPRHNPTRSEDMGEKKLSPADELAKRKQAKPEADGVTELGKRRRKKGLALEDVADAVGVSDALLKAYESGSKEPSLAVAFKLAAFYGEKVDKLFDDRKPKGEQEPEAPGVPDEATPTPPKDVPAEPKEAEAPPAAEPAPPEPPAN